MANWIEFELNGCLCRLNREDSYDLQIWFVKCGRSVLKKPYWKQLSIWENCKYLNCRINNRSYRHHRVVYFAYNPDWDINDSCSNNQIDHIDRDRLNNHITNLRVVTNAENQQNTKAKGYGYHKANKKWIAYIRLNDKQEYLGSFDTEEEAKQARAEAVRKYHPYNMRQS